MYVHISKCQYVKYLYHFGKTHHNIKLLPRLKSHTSTSGALGGVGALTLTLGAGEAHFLGLGDFAVGLPLIVSVELVTNF